MQHSRAVLDTALFLYPHRGSIGGIILLFVVAPEKDPDPQFGVTFAIEDGSRDRWRKRITVKKRWALFSVIVMAVGFGLQGIALVFW